MATEIKMPQLSDTMSSGKILVWRVSEGEQVQRGAVLAEVETDKANLEIEAFIAGTVLKILVPEGQTANIGDVIAQIGEAGEKVTNHSLSVSNKPAEAIETKPIIEYASLEPSNVVQQNFGRPTLKQPDLDDRVRISPLAKKLADQNQVNVQSLKGSGPQGRIIKKDVEEAIGESIGSQASIAKIEPAQKVETSLKTETASANISTNASDGTFTPLSKMRAAIASRMQAAVIEAPHFYTTVSVNMLAAQNLRNLFKQKAEFKSISVNHMIIKAAAYALKHEPKVNCSVKNNMLFQPNQINIGIVTAITDGLLIPVLKNCDQLKLKDIAFEARAAVERARAGRPNSSDLTGGTFSISNMGMFDVENFTAIISPGQGAILAVSSILDQPVIEAGKILARPVMKVTLSVDHRIIDGLMAGKFLKYFKEALEHPALLMV